MQDLIFITPSLKTGGGNRVFLELANCLAEDFSVQVICPNNSEENNTFDINPLVAIEKVGSLGKNKFQKIANIKKTFKMISSKFYNATVIVSDPILCLFLRRIKKVKDLHRFIQADDYRIFDDGYILKSRILIKIYKTLCLKSYHDKIKFIFNSKYVYDSFCQDSGRSDVPYNLVYPAINHDMFYNMFSSDRQMNICLVGRKHPWKGLATLSKAFQILSESVKDKISKIFIISHEDLSEFEFPLNTVIVKPTSDIDISMVYNKSLIFISTSWWEGFGLPGLEAMACGCAVITSDSGGCREYAIDRENCLYFTPKNDVELSERIETLVTNHNLMKTLSEKGMESAKKFSWKNSALQLKRIIENERITSEARP